MKRFVSFVVAAACGMLALTASAAQVGIKYNRPKREYPQEVLRDFQRLHADRIRTVMLCLPWSQWEPEPGQLDTEFVATRLQPVLAYCATNGMTVVLSAHCSFWGEKGNWSIPKWVRAQPGFESATSCLTDPAIRKLHISFLERLLHATHDFPAVVGYNLLNEPVAASNYSINKAATNFAQRWHGVVDICQQVRQHATQTGVKQYLMIGHAPGEAAFSKYAWVNNGHQDLQPLWTRTLDRIAAQNLSELRESALYYPHRPRIRTEDCLNYHTLSLAHEAEDFVQVKVAWNAKGDHGTVLYDYDAVYRYEGEGNAAIPDLEAFYPWRIGNAAGSASSLLLFDHRHNDRPTPYYWALRDLASGVDSFENLAVADLPANGAACAAFDPLTAQPGISQRWSGTGKLEGVRPTPPAHPDSLVAAQVTLQPGQRVVRSVIAAHWRDNGVNAADAFVFQAKTAAPGRLTLTVDVDGTTRSAVLDLAPGNWRQYQLPLRRLKISDKKIPAIRAVGFANATAQPLQFLVDDFLIR